MRQIRFDDLPALRAMTSERFGPWGPRFHLTQHVIDEFADLTGDHQWIHTDLERAGRGPYGGTIAHGLLTLALLPKIRTPQPFEVIGQGSTVNYGSDGFRFLAPVRAGDHIHAQSRMTEVREHRRGTRLTLEIHVHVVDNERPSLVYRAITLHSPPTPHPAPHPAGR